jgi:hypothetical protein
MNARMLKACSRRGASLALATSLLVLSHGKGASADVSSWAFVGGGALSVEQPEHERELGSFLLVETGLGTPPSSPIVLGGLFRLAGLFGDGVDLGLSARAATSGFVTGGFGLALDAGPYQRLWGVKSTGGHAALVFGAPWGINLSIQGGLGSNDARHFGAALGLDFARLTVYRLTGESWMPNPNPAYRPTK